MNTRALGDLVLQLPEYDMLDHADIIPSSQAHLQPQHRIQPRYLLTTLCRMSALLESKEIFRLSLDYL